MDRDEVLEAIDVAKSQKLKKLSLSNRGITELPSEIGKLNLLQKLDLSYNNIEILPDEFCRLHNLRSLYLNHNDLNDLPDRFGSLTNLNTLDLSNNKIEVLPDTIGNLNNLVHLDLSFNNIRTLPLAFINLTALKKLYLDSNPSEFPPEKVIKRGLYATMHYLFGELRKKESSKVIMQVYNMPRDLITPFNEYVNCFNDLVSSTNEQNIHFDVKYIKQDFTADVDMDVEVENYLVEFMQFLRKNINDKSFREFKKTGPGFDEVQLLELRDQLKSVNSSLDDKVEEIRNLQEKINYLSKIIGKKK
jgi:hypothetical protein